MKKIRFSPHKTPVTPQTGLTTLPTLETTSTTPLEGLDASTLKAPPSRIRDPLAAHNLFRKLKLSDRESSRQRYHVQSMFDGAPPYIQAQLIELGQAHRTNINFNEASSLREVAQSAYLDLINSVDVLAYCKVLRGTPEERATKTQVLSEEYTALMRSDSEFEFNTQLLTGKFIEEGVAVAMFDHPVDYRWKPSWLGDFYFPRKTPAHEAGIEVAVCTRVYQQHELYEKISGNAVTPGWNVKAVKEVLIRAAFGELSRNVLEDWERYEQTIKNNDLEFSFTNGEVSINHYWVKEYDGRVSHYMLDYDGQSKDFLFEKRGMYGCMSNCFVVFAYGVGNGSIHSIRGMGYKIFPHIQVSNRLRCQVVDNAFLSSSLLVQADNVDSLQKLSLMYYGPFAVLPDGLEIKEHDVPNVMQTAMPVINDLSIQLQTHTGSYRPKPAELSGQEKTKFEVQMQANSDGTLSAMAMNLFYGPWRRLHQETFRRLQNLDYQEDHPGGKQVYEFRRRCLARGVTFEDIQSVKDIVPVRAVGNGSPTQRLLAYDAVDPLFGTFDEEGKNAFVRDKINAYMPGGVAADRYMPKMENVRMPEDQRFALMENSVMAIGGSAVVAPTDNAMLHLTSHTGAMVQTFQELKSGQMNPQTAFTFFGSAIPHCQQHLQVLSQNPFEKDSAKEFEQVLKMADSFAKQIQSALEAQQQEQPQGGAGVMDPKVQSLMQEHLVRMEIMQKEASLKQQIRQSEAQQKMALRDLTHAQRMKERAGL